MIKLKNGPHLGGQHLFFLLLLHTSSLPMLCMCGALGKLYLLVRCWNIFRNHNTAVSLLKSHKYAKCAWNINTGIMQAHQISKYMWIMFYSSKWKWWIIYTWALWYSDSLTVFCTVCDMLLGGSNQTSACIEVSLLWHIRSKGWAIL